jgi:hypothetical protein
VGEAIRLLVTRSQVEEALGLPGEGTGDVEVIDIFIKRA